MPRRRLQLHIVPVARWDRTGYQPFQESRLGLVAALDRLIEGLAAKPGGGSLLLGGQTILLEDYLEIRPQQAESLATLIQSGQIEIGPWYVRPAEFLSSPEALVRNLTFGSVMATRFGGRLNVGCLDTRGGHIAQMPQILRGFGISTAIASHLPDIPLSTLRWEAPDGSGILLLPICLLTDNEDEFGRDDYKLGAEAQRIATLLKNARASGSVAILVALPDEYEAASSARLAEQTRDALHHAEVVVSNLTGFADSLSERQSELTTILGELDSPHWQPLSPGILSTRIWLKQRNHATETLLERWAEPFGAWVSILEAGWPANNRGRPPGYLRNHAQILQVAWRLLLQNHSFSAISGASDDRAQVETRVRFDQAEQIAGKMVQQSLQYLAANVDATPLSSPGEAVPIVVFNACDQPQTDVIVVEIDVADRWKGIHLVDDAGTEQAVETLNIPAESTPSSESSHRIAVRFAAQDVPPFGYRTYVLQPGLSEPPTPTTDDGSSIENEYLGAELDVADGTIALFDKRSGRTFSGLNRYVDGGDRGDAYLYAPPERDTIISVPTNTPLHPERHIGLAEQSLHILQIFRLPLTLTEDRMARLPLTAQFVPVSVWTTYRLKRGLPRLDIEVIVANTARDHRFSVHFPTGIYAQEAFYDGHFEVLQRPLALPDAQETLDWAEQPASQKPQRAFVTVLGDDSGLTIANRGLPEVAVYATPQGCEVALTLLRCVGWMGRDDLPNRLQMPGPLLEIPEAQCLGEYAFAYSVIPHGPDPLPAWRQAWAFQTPLHAIQAARRTGALPLSASLVRSDQPAFVITAVKAADNTDGLIVRGYNVYPSALRVTLELAFPFRQAELVRMDETPLGIRLKAGRGRRTTSFDAAPYQIVTVHFTGLGT